MSDQAEHVISILLVDDQQMFAESVARILEREPDFEVLGISGSVSTCLERLESVAPDVVVLDFQLPDGDGIQAASQVKALRPSTQILLLTAVPDKRLLTSAIEAGCSGFMTKDKAISELASAVRQLYAGEAYIPPELLSGILPRLGRDYRKVGSDLTAREREILQLIASGLSNRAIARELVSS